ncbi:MAG: hypothetical protein IAI49_03530 [Candidatus Eremiobacteraeota bacterium]|nr:hypothetical protein [Candidatus Eremiobacteraeota bacterium]
MSAGEFDILRSAAAGMDAQRAALDLAARNVAASEADGATFERLIPRYAVGPAAGQPAETYEPPADLGDDDGETDAGGNDGAADTADGSSLPVRYLGALPVRGVAPDAVTEMVAVLDAQRAYDADASVFDVGKRLSERTIDMGRLQ